MTLIVCPVHDLAGEIGRSRPARVISLLGPDQAAPDVPGDVARLTLRFHDIAAPSPGLIAPDQARVEALLAFGRAWTEPGPMVVHCWMGISRSPAAALALACAADPSRDEEEIALALRRASPTATPNPLIVALADDLLGRGGRLARAAARIGRGTEAAHGAAFQLPARIAHR